MTNGGIVVRPGAAPPVPTEAVHVHAPDSKKLQG